MTDRPSEMTTSHKEITVQRVVVSTGPVNEDYARVELVIDGETFEMSRPEAQHLGQILYRAGAGPAGQLTAAAFVGESTLGAAPSAPPEPGERDA